MHACELDVHATSGWKVAQSGQRYTIFLDYIRHYLFGYPTNTIWQHLSIHVKCLTK